VLAIDALTVVYGGLHALSAVSLEVREGQFVAIVGPNGAGKTTLFKTISGTVAPLSGSIRYDGHDLLAVPPAARPHLGIAHVPEGRQVFGSMSVIENLEMGAYPDTGRRHWTRSLERIFALFPVLAERRHQMAGTLSGGEQQMLAIGRGIASAPRLLMLDEPSMGIAPILVDRIYETIVEINKQGTTILLVEQNANYALGVSMRGYVLETGVVALTDASDALRTNPDVQRAYLGA
jgi:branched-chain amino acid transport system ATP-binding protein